MAPAPRVSVIVPNYNHGRFLAQRLRSIIDQSFGELELIYLDDASTDDSAEVFSRFASDPRVRADALQHASVQNSGNPFRQWNRGAALARGEYLWIAESDDYADARLLERLVALLDAHPSVGIAHCESLAVDEAGVIRHSLANRTRKLDPERWQHDFIVSGERECRRTMILKNTIPNASAVVFRKRIFDAAGGAEEGLQLSGDWMTWVRMLLRCDLAFVAEPLNYFRHHERSVRRKSEREGLQTLEAYQIQSEIRACLDLGEEESEAALDYILLKWRNRTFRVRNRIPMRVGAQIHRVARGVDARLYSRMGRQLRGLLRPGAPG